ncbi:hypothetical protein QBC34DRAFT_466147 [Podospora aff. communis PSN243]|uniref:Amine oxidase domain-containing protein n=1 Tax=Podospora aff. communis PSN243 TaxID=3040156 RepID=A0AAV9GHP2_9PEZI|nr:hypothetical protein QBC34DRAFT_466147 [Podospora aff. communis PSN243]
MTGANKGGARGSNSNGKHVGIIGAGVAGLRSADALLREGFRVTVVEGRDRVGGRVHQHRLPNGHEVDVGPNWIHGAADNPFMDLARETGTAVCDFDAMTGGVVDEDGELLPAEQGADYSLMMWTLFERAFERSRSRGTEIDASTSLLDFCREQVLEMIPETDQDSEKKRRILLQMCKLWGNYVGSPVERQSLKFFWLEETIEGENLFCAGTYRRILGKIAQPAVERANILYQTRVVEVRGKSTSSHGRVSVVTAGGRVLDFDELIVTAPLGWLKQNLGAFHPPLPDRLSRAIQSIGYGSLEKVYISFPKAFWLAGEKAVRGFCHWLSPNYEPERNPHRWVNEALELGSLDGPDGHATLLFYINGDESRHITSKVRSLSEGREREGFLFDFFKPYYSRLPSYEEGDPDCQPNGCLSTDWLGDDLAGNGSYSNFQVGLQEGDQDIILMRAGIPEEGIWLAGEHTAPFIALGTVAGAYLSGENVAKRIMATSNQGYAESN